MRFCEAPISGVWLIDIDPVGDARGFFARTVCTEEFAMRGLESRMVQQSVSWNPVTGTLRGLHFQSAPFAEDKLVRITRGAVFDVVVDLRPESSTFAKWYGVHLSMENRRQIYIPPGVAHGFQTLEENTEVFYQMTTPYSQQHARGLRWNDPAIGIEWPLPASVVSERDQVFPFLNDMNLGE